MNASGQILKIQNVSLHFGGIQALDQISLEVDQGLLFSLIGPNGAGKTSLVNCISKFYTPSNGQIFFKNRDITNFSPTRSSVAAFPEPFKISSSSKR